MLVIVRKQGSRSLELLPEICKFINPKQCTAEQLDFIQNFVLPVLLSSQQQINLVDNLLWF
jgi:hypothetical protein